MSQPIKAMETDHLCEEGKGKRGKCLGKKVVPSPGRLAASGRPASGRSRPPSRLGEAAFCTGHVTRLENRARAEDFGQAMPDTFGCLRHIAVGASQQSHSAPH